MKMKQNPTSDFQQLHNVDTTSVPDVETTSKQRYITSKQHGDNSGDIHRSLKYCIRNLKISLKNIKI